MGIFHKDKYRIQYDTLFNSWDVHIDEGFIFRDWWILDSVGSQEAAVKVVEKHKIKKDNPRFTYIEYL